VKNIITVIILLVSLPAMAVTGPEQLIRQTSNIVITEINANRDSYQDNPQKVHALVDELVSPHFDFAAMTDLALGKYKDRISTEQRSVIINEFRLLLLRTYSSVLLEYTDQELIYLPMGGSEAEGWLPSRPSTINQVDFRSRSITTCASVTMAGRCLMSKLMKSVW